MNAGKKIHAALSPGEARDPTIIWNALVVDLQLSRINPPNLSAAKVRQPDRPMTGSNAVAARACPLRHDGVATGINASDWKLFQRRPDRVESECNLAAFAREPSVYVSNTAVCFRVHSRHRAVALIQCPYGSGASRQESWILPHVDAGHHAVGPGIDLAEHAAFTRSDPQVTVEKYRAERSRRNPNAGDHLVRPGVNSRQPSRDSTGHPHAAGPCRNAAL